MTGALRYLHAASDRRDARPWLLRSAVRLSTRGAMRYFAYWSVDTMMARRRGEELRAARERWEETKITLAATLEKLAYEGRPMDYRTFVASRARASDSAAERVFADLTAPQQPRASDARVDPRKRPEQSPIHETAVSVAPVSRVRAQLESNSPGGIATRERDVPGSGQR